MLGQCQVVFIVVISQGIILVNAHKGIEPMWPKKWVMMFKKRTMIKSNKSLRRLIWSSDMKRNQLFASFKDCYYPQSNLSPFNDTPFFALSALSTSNFAMWLLVVEVVTIWCRNPWLRCYHWKLRHTQGFTKSGGLRNRLRPLFVKCMSCFFL